MMRAAVGAALVLVLAAGCTAPAAEPPAVPMTEHGVALAPDDMQWQDGPASLPPGARFALLQGDLAKPEFIALRLAFPAQYEIPPHWHEGVEHVTVLSGTLHVGMGATVDRDLAIALPAGSFAVVPNTEPHFAFTGDDPVVFQLHSIGPWGITYVDPADDPR